jgi:hypothetical protein
MLSPMAGWRPSEEAWCRFLHRRGIRPDFTYLLVIRDGMLPRCRPSTYEHFQDAVGNRGGEDRKVLTTSGSHR